MSKSRMAPKEWFSCSGGLMVTEDAPTAVMVYVVFWKSLKVKGSPTPGGVVVFGAIWITLSPAR